ncbi:hypothetical protein C8Q77DRAFT_9222 [Trametes polyzona]|nr:hypothetical protein C8Q77DRAFT_9222 [Trametes polyzona]
MPPSPSKLSRKTSRAAKARSASASSSSSQSPGGRTAASPSSSEPSSDAESTHSHPEYGLLDLDEPLRCGFQDGESVWVRPKDSEEWIPGVVSGKGARTGATRDGEGTLYPVRYRKTKREYFSPQNGNVKPDTPEVRSLLVAGGWLQEV